MRSFAPLKQGAIALHTKQPDDEGVSIFSWAEQISHKITQDALQLTAPLLSPHHPIPPFVSVCVRKLSNLQKLYYTNKNHLPPPTSQDPLRTRTQSINKHFNTTTGDLDNILNTLISPIHPLGARLWLIASRKRSALNEPFKGAYKKSRNN